MERKDGGGREAGSLVRGSNGGSGKDAAPSVVDDDSKPANLTDLGTHGPQTVLLRPPGSKF